MSGQKNVVKFQFPRVTFEEGAWIKVSYEKDGKRRHARGVILAMPELIILRRRPSRTLVIPFGDIIDVESYAPKRIVEQWEMERQARLMSKTLREREKWIQKITGFNRFLADRERWRQRREKESRRRRQ